MYKGRDCVSISVYTISAYENVGRPCSLYIYSKFVVVVVFKSETVAKFLACAC